MAFVKKHLATITIILTILLGLYLRLYKIDFGLPCSFLYDELDIYYEVIKFSLNYKFIIPKEGFMGFAPQSYVYGMFPTYFLTFSTMVLNKIISIFNSSVNFDFYFVYMRIINSIFSMFGVIFTFLIYKKVFKDKKGTLIAILLASLNWKMIQHSHYLNHDTFLMVFTVSSIYFLISYLEKKEGKNRYFYLSLSSILFGFAVGTKITALLSAPLWA